MEIERKFLIKEVPADIESYPSYEIEQGYLCRKPVVRVRRGGEKYTLTYKGGGMMAREEYNLPLDADSYKHLITKADGTVIRKRRYLLAYGDYTIELDHFECPREGLWLAEVEFESVEEAMAFDPPQWFGDDVTQNPEYHNSSM